MGRTSLLVALLAAVALAPALAVPRPHAGDEPGLGGWGARAPAWQDPGGRATGSAGGDAPRAAPPAQTALRRHRDAPRRTRLTARRTDVRRPCLAILGRRQADGG